MNKYNQKFYWLKQGTTLDPTYGEHSEGFSTNGEIWGYVEFTGGGSETDDYGIRKEIVNAIIHVHQWVSITNLDRLKDKRFGDLWYIDAVIRSFKPYELMIQATRKAPMNISNT